MCISSWCDNTRDHPQMIQVFLGHSGGFVNDGNELPWLVYVSREKRPGFQHHKKVGAMNVLVWVFAVLTNGPFLLNLDCDHYINNNKALREAMCFLMDPSLRNKTCHVQFVMYSSLKYLMVLIDMIDMQIVTLCSLISPWEVSMVSKGPWTTEEDGLLVKLVEEYGMWKWSQIAQTLAGAVKDGTIIYDLKSREICGLKKKENCWLRLT